MIVSACLLGEYCRYDGKTKQDTELLQALRDYEIIPFCPEDPLFGTPRERIHVMELDGKRRIITDETNKDVTQLLEEEVRSFVQKNPYADKIILKSKSPSCGFGTTPIVDTNKVQIKQGNGIACEIFLKHYGEVIEDEISFLALK